MNIFSITELARLGENGTEDFTRFLSFRTRLDEVLKKQEE